MRFARCQSPQYTHFGHQVWKEVGLAMRSVVAMWAAAIRFVALHLFPTAFQLQLEDAQHIVSHFKDTNPAALLSESTPQRLRGQLIMVKECLLRDLLFASALSEKPVCIAR